MEDTIVAIATSLGESAINIIRLSGKDSINIVNKIFIGKDLNKVNGNTINYGFIVDKNEKIDEVLISIFKSPKSYTQENMVEINCHGGVSSVNKILELCLKNGSRPAEPGEFLKRAFLNGRVDLIEAESVSDIIKAKTDKSRKLSMAGINGELSLLVNNIKEEILSLIANIEVNIDYPEYEDNLVVTNKLIKEKITNINERIKEILKDSKNGKLIKEGLIVSIIGKPNVGKSSILNILINEDKAIVTNIPGTTRDIVEGSIILNGIEVKLIDTAGIRKTKNIVESLGVKKSIDLINKSDLLIVVLNNNEELTTEDKHILQMAHDKKSIILINKKDLKNKLDKDKLKNLNIIETSTINKEGIKELKDQIIKMFNLNKLDKDFTYLSNARQISLLEKSLEIIKNIKTSVQNKELVDMIEIDIKRLYNTLCEITGEVYDDEILDKIFKNFCLGK